ncbi:MAG: hypothetical protein U0Z17_05950 [Bacteroidales bacterium]
MDYFSIGEMTLSSTNAFLKEVPAFGSGTVKYYIFTSGNSLTIPPADADLYTINLLNNGGSNYEYTIQSGTVRFSATNGNWSENSTWEGE